ncbi:Cell division cycle and apoptosis regulator protein 1 [Homalodisca vitripennis]|nr:Cell division cycle and apoptosis regulator protein 1 [Homalodisca vitripennis]
MVVRYCRYDNLSDQLTWIDEEEKKKLDEKEKQLLEKRYTLPEKSHILAHPSRIAKSGKFDCTVMSLSLLLDYRPEDSKEHSFEVSLFAELFNEMLMRDFGFQIYKALVEVPEKPKEEKEDKDKNKDKDKEKEKDKDKEREKEKDKKSDRDKSAHSEKKEDRKDDKRDDKNSIEDDDGSGDEEDSKKDRRDSDRKKKERVKVVTVDPYLLLSFVYFDQTHCGYIFDKDIEELLFTLGLSLSRAQIKKLVQKVISRDSLHYRKLTDKPKDDPTAKQNGAQTTEDLMTLALGNKRLFPIFEEAATPSKRSKKGSDKKAETPELPSGFVMFNGSLLDINKLQSQFKRSEETRVKTEKLLEKLRSDNESWRRPIEWTSLRDVATQLPLPPGTAGALWLINRCAVTTNTDTEHLKLITNLKETTNRNVATIKKLSSELKDFKERLTNTNSELCTMDVSSKFCMFFVCTESKLCTD